MSEPPPEGEGGGADGGRFGSFLGQAGSSSLQLFIWNVLGAIVGAAMTPFLQAIQQEVSRLDPNTPISPADAANLAARGLVSLDYGKAQAVKAGLDGDNFERMVAAATSAADLGTLVAAYQRGLIGEGSGDPTTATFTGGLARAGLDAAWWPIVQKLTVDLPSWQDVLNAWLEGQIDETTARQWISKTGLDPDWIQIGYDATGQAPTPVQALELANRGIIPWTGTGPQAVTYEQAFLEGPWRNKWEPSFRALAEYIPPPRTITAMYHDGQIDAAMAADALMANGLTPQWAAAYLKPAHSSVSTATEKHLAKTDILSALTDGVFTAAQATDALVKIGYAQADATMLVELSTMRDTVAQLKAGITRVRSMFQTGKIDAAAARKSLGELGVSDSEARDLIDTWQITAATASGAKDLSASQIESAVYYDLITEGEGMARLEALGYDEAEAWLALAVRLHAPLRTIPRPASLGAPPAPPELTNPGTPAP